MGFRGMVAELKKAFCNKIFYAVILATSVTDDLSEAKGFFKAN